ncbi:MAG: hypothetical protein AAF355_02000 [Myxococcota bacterium]
MIGTLLVVRLVRKTPLQRARQGSVPLASTLETGKPAARLHPPEAVTHRTVVEQDARNAIETSHPRREQRTRASTPSLTGGRRYIAVGLSMPFRITSSANLFRCPSEPESDQAIDLSPLSRGGDRE